MSQPLLSGKQPNTVSKKRKLGSLCLLCTEECQEEFKSNLDGWNNLEENSRNWCGLDNFGDASGRVNWENGPEGMYLHFNCKMKLFNKRFLEQARKRKEKERAQREEEEKNKDDDQDRKRSQLESPEIPKITPRRSSTGRVHSKNLCIWCIKLEDTRHKDRKNSKLHLLNQLRLISFIYRVVVRALQASKIDFFCENS